MMNRLAYLQRELTIAMRRMRQRDEAAQQTISATQECLAQARVENVQSSETIAALDSYVLQLEQDNVMLSLDLQ